MNLPKIKKINVVDIDLDWNIWIHGDGDSVVFEGGENTFELSWKEIYSYCKKGMTEDKDG